MTFNPLDLSSTAEPDDLDLTQAQITSAIARVRTITPGIIISYNAARQTASVQPMLRNKRYDIETEEVKSSVPNIIDNVPVVHLRGGSFALSMPVEKDDLCLLLVSDKSIDEWQARARSDDKDLDPRDLRRHALTDAFALVGVSSLQTVLENASDDKLRLGSDGTGVRLELNRSTDEVTLGTSTIELLERVSATIAATDTALSDIQTFCVSLGAATDPVVSGAANVLNLALVSVRLTLASIKADVDTLRG